MSSHFVWVTQCMRPWHTDRHRGLLNTLQNFCSGKHRVWSVRQLLMSYLWHHSSVICFSHELFRQKETAHSRITTDWATHPQATVDPDGPYEQDITHVVGMETACSCNTGYLWESRGLTTPTMHWWIEKTLSTVTSQLTYNCRAWATFSCIK